MPFQEVLKSNRNMEHYYCPVKESQKDNPMQFAEFA